MAFALGPMLTVWLVRADDARRGEVAASPMTRLESTHGAAVGLGRAEAGGEGEGNYVLADE